MQPLQHAHLRCPPRRIRRRAPQNVIKRSTLGSCADPSKISVGKSSTSSENREWKTPCRVKLDMRSAVPGLGYFGIIGIRFGTPVFATSFIPFWCTVFHDICFPLLGPRSAPWVGIKMFSTVSIPRFYRSVWSMGLAGLPTVVELDHSSAETGSPGKAKARKPIVPADRLKMGRTTTREVTAC